MSRKRTVRRVWATVNPLTHALYQASKLMASEWNTHIVPVQAAIDSLLIGEWTADNWGVMMECLTRIESMLKLNRADDQGFVEQAQTAMVKALDRQRDTGAKAFRSEEIATMREIVAVYGDLLKEVTHAQFRSACSHTNANITRILRSKKEQAPAIIRNFLEI